MKKTLLTIMIIMGFCIPVSQAQCEQVIFPFCGGQSGGQMPPGVVLSNPNCPTVEIIDPTDYGTIAHVGAGGNLEDRFDSMSYFYQLDATTNCFADEFIAVECCDNTGVLVCDTITYHIELRCETPDNVFCCIPPGVRDTFDVLQNDNTFLDLNYPGGTVLTDSIFVVSSIHPRFEAAALANNTIEYSNLAGTAGIDTISYNVVYEIITADGDTVTVCDEQFCYVLVENCLYTNPDEVYGFEGDTLCIDPLANDLVDPMFPTSLFEELGCSNSLPSLDPATLNISPLSPLVPPLWSDGQGAWCFTSTTPGTYTYLYEICTDLGECSIDTMRFIVDNLPSSCVGIKLYAYLEGAHDISTGLMRTDLNMLELLPGQSNNPTTTPVQQPYNIAPWSYNGTESVAAYPSDIVDWVLVGFRTNITPDTEFAKAAALLHEDGKITFPNPCVLPFLPLSSVYIVVEHRNHMGIMTPSPVVPTPVTPTVSMLAYDFRAANSYDNAGAASGQKLIAPGLWAYKWQ